MSKIELNKNEDAEKRRNQRAMIEGINNLLNKHKSVMDAAEALPINKNEAPYKRLKDALTKYRAELEKSKND